jgi:hypothetical protein
MMENENIKKKMKRKKMKTEANSMRSGKSWDLK